MGKITSGPMLGVSGSFGGLTFSPQKDGTTNVSEKNKKSDIPLTPNQLSVLRDTEIFADFMKPLSAFVLVGYDLEAQIRRVNPYNAMVICVRKNAVQGVYPERSIDFSKVLMTKGTLPVTKASAEITKTGITFTWDTLLIAHNTHHSDQVIMLAYFPELKETRYVTAGAHRFKGNDTLPLAGIKKGYQAEVYISFITDDRRNISNSVYLGQLNW